ISFLPDATIFGVTEFNFEALSGRLRELAFLNRGVSISLIDEREDRRIDFQFDGGIASFVELLARNKDPIHTAPVYMIHEDESDGVTVEVALQWTGAYQERLLCFANNIRNRDGGTHETAFKTALTRTINTFAQ